MLPLHLTLAKARRLWHQDFEVQCAALPLQMRCRTHQAKVDADGSVLAPTRTERYWVQPKAAPATAKNTMSDLILLAIRALERKNREGLDLGPDAAPLAPSISVNQDAGRALLALGPLGTHPPRPAAEDGRHHGQGLAWHPRRLRAVDKS